MDEGNSTAGPALRRMKPEEKQEHELVEENEERMREVEAPGQQEKVRGRGVSYQPVPDCLTGSLWNPLRLRRFAWFSWVVPFMARGYKSSVEESDLFDIPTRHKAKVVTDRLEGAWREERAKNPEQPSLLRAYIRTFAPSWLFILFILTVQLVCITLQPYCLSKIVSDLGSGSSDSDAYRSALGLSLATIFSLILHHTASWEMWRCGMEMRTASLGMIYRKSLAVGLQSLRDTTTGHVITMGSADVERLVDAPVFVPFVVVATLESFGEIDPLSTC